VFVQRQQRPVDGESGGPARDGEVVGRLARLLAERLAGDDAVGVDPLGQALRGAIHVAPEREHPRAPGLGHQILHRVAAGNLPDAHVLGRGVAHERPDGLHGSRLVVGTAVLAEVDVDRHDLGAALHQLPGGDGGVDAAADERDDPPL